MAIANTSADGGCGIGLVDLGSAIIGQIAEIGKCHQELRGVSREFQAACDAARQSLRLQCACQATDTLVALAKWPSLTSLKLSQCQACLRKYHDDPRRLNDDHAPTKALLMVLNSRRLARLNLYNVKGVDQGPLVDLLQSNQGSLTVLELFDTRLSSYDQDVTPLVHAIKGLRLKALDISEFRSSPEKPGEYDVGEDWTRLLTGELSFQLESLSIAVSAVAPEGSSFWVDLGERLRHLQRLEIRLNVLDIHVPLVCEMAGNCKQLRDLVVIAVWCSEIAERILEIAPQLPHLESLDVNNSVVPSTFKQFAERCNQVKHLTFPLGSDFANFDLFRLGCRYLVRLESFELDLSEWEWDDPQGEHRAKAVPEGSTRFLIAGLLALSRLRLLTLREVPVFLGWTVNECIWSLRELRQVTYQFGLFEEVPKSMTFEDWQPSSPRGRGLVAQASFEKRIPIVQYK